MKKPGNRYHSSFVTGLLLLALCVARIGLGSVDVSLSVAPTSSSIHLTIGGTLNAVQYKVYRASDLVLGDWTLIGTVLGSGSSSSFDDLTIGAAPKAFYRIGFPGQISSLIPQTYWSLESVDSQELTAGSWGPATPATSAFDGNPATIWNTQWLESQTGYPHDIQINLGAVYNISGFRELPRQDGVPYGRIAGYQFYVSMDGVNWGTPVASGTFANNATQQEVDFPPIAGQFVQLRALSPWIQGDFTASLAELNVLTADNLPPVGQIISPSADVTILAGSSVTFAGSGTDPDGDLPLRYDWNFGTGSGIPDSISANPGAVQFNIPGTYVVTLTVSDSMGNPDPVPPTRVVTVWAPLNSISPVDWSLVYVDSQELTAGSWGPANPATSAFDGNPNTFWTTQWLESQPGYPHEIQINVGALYNISGFRELPRQDGISNGRIAGYEFYVSMDGVNWGTAVATGTFSNSAAEQEVRFTPKWGQYVRLRALSDNGIDGFSTSVAEINVLTADSLPAEGQITSPLSDLTIPVGGAVTFAGSGTDPGGNLPLTFHWNFGTGSGIADSTSANPGPVQFNNPGTYVVTLTVSNSLGIADPMLSTRVITVTAGTILIPQTAWTLWYADSQATGSNPAYYYATNAFDGNPNTIWETQYDYAHPPPHEIQINLGSVYNLTGFSYLPVQGISNPRIGEYEFYVSMDGVNWGTPVATGQFPNSPQQQQVLFTPNTGQYVRLRALTEVDGLFATSVAELNVLQAGIATSQVPSGSITFPTADATIVAGSGIDFTASGSDPGGNLPLTYRWSFQTGSGIEDITAQNPGLVRFTQPGTFVVTYRVANSLGFISKDTRTITVQGGNLPIPTTNWALWFVDSQDSANGNYATHAFDGNSNSFWQTQSVGVAPLPPHEIQIDLGATYDVGGFGYLPRQDENSSGNIGLYRFYVSADGTNWGKPVAYGSFPNSAAQQEVLFASTRGRYVRLQATSNVVGEPYISVAELTVLQAPVITPSVRLLAPTSNYLQTSSNLNVLCNASIINGQGIRIAIDGGLTNGGAQYDLYSAPYEVTFTGISQAPHTIDAYVIDPGGAVVTGVATHDQATQVGIGEYDVAMGDSITYGLDDDIHTDDTSADGRTTGGGYEPNLADTLATASGLPCVIANAGIGGVNAYDGTGQIPRVLQKYPNVRRILIMYGTNDGEPSGLGLHPGDPGYAGSYKDYMQQIINDINSAGKTAILAKPPVKGGLNSPADLIVQTYCSIIDELVADSANKIPVTGPDFHSYFAAHPENYAADLLHPNGMGYQAMASLWFQVLYP